MVQLSSFSKQQAHDLIEQLTPAQLSVVLALMENIIDPQNLSLHRAPFSDELLEETPPSRTPGRPPSSTRIFTSDERTLAEFGLIADDSDFWPPAGQA